MYPLSVITPAPSGNRSSNPVYRSTVRSWGRPGAAAETVTTGYLVAALAAFGVIVAGVVLQLMPPFTLLALAALPLVFRVHRGLVANYSSPYALMSFMGINVNLHLLTGVGLLVGYVIAIVAAALL